MNDLKQTNPNAQRAADEPKSGQAPGLDADFQALLEAVTKVAEVSARPVIRTLRTVEQSVSGQTSPRIRLHGLQSTSVDLVSTSLKLVEKLANLALDAVAGGRATIAADQGDQNPASVPGTAAGQTLKLPMAVENPSAVAMQDLSFMVESLEGPVGTTLTRHAARVVPEKQTIQPGDFEKVVVLVSVPDDAHPGAYSGNLAIEGHDVKVPFRFVVGAAAKAP